MCVVIFAMYARPARLAGTRGMNRQRSFPTMILAGAFLALCTLGTGCASGPRYGAARKKKKSCDCPHWNAVPEQKGVDGMRSWNTDPSATDDHASLN